MVLSGTHSGPAASSSFAWKCARVLAQTQARPGPGQARPGRDAGDLLSFSAWPQNMQSLNLWEIKVNLLHCILDLSRLVADRKSQRNIKKDRKEKHFLRPLSVLCVPFCWLCDRWMLCACFLDNFLQSNITTTATTTQCNINCIHNKAQPYEDSLRGLRSELFKFEVCLD